MEYFRSWPFPLAVLVLYGIVLARTSAMYGLARAARAGAGHTKIRRLFATSAYRKAERIVDRWGALAVVFGFLTVGLQSMINLVAGATRMPLRRYLPALGIGGLVWAVWYASIGGVVIQGWWHLVRTSPVAGIAVAVALLAVIATIVVVQVRRPKEPAEEIQLAPAPAEPKGATGA